MEVWNVILSFNRHANDPWPWRIDEHPSRSAVINRAKSYGNVHRHVFIDDLACSNALCKVSKSQEALLCTVRTSTNRLTLECKCTKLTEQVFQIMNSHWYCPTSTHLALWEHLSQSKTALKCNPTTQQCVAKSLTSTCATSIMGSKNSFRGDITQKTYVLVV